MADRKRIEKHAKKERKKLLKTPIKHEPVAMQPPRKDDDVTNSAGTSRGLQRRRRGRPCNSAEAGSSLE